jgi:hypothetical protein
MMLILRSIVRLVETLLMILLGLIGLGVALYCLDGLISLGSARPDRLLHLPQARRAVGNFLHRIALMGPAAALAGLCGLVAMALGVAIVIGLLGRRRQHVAVLDGGSDGTLGVRARVMRDMLRSLAVGTPDATQIKRPRVRLARRGRGGRVRLTAFRSPTSDARAVRASLSDNIAPITNEFGLRSRVSVRTGGRGRRVT